MNSAEEASIMFNEIGTVGVGMAVLVTCAWGVLAMATSVFDKKEVKKCI